MTTNYFYTFKINFSYNNSLIKCWNQIKIPSDEEALNSTVESTVDVDDELTRL